MILKSRRQFTNAPIETKEKAQQLAKLLDANKLQEAQDEFSKYCTEKKMMLWEANAFADLVQSYKKTVMEKTQ